MPTVSADEQPLYLAIDQGGHASRVLVFDARGAVVATTLREVGVCYPGPQQVEHDPDELVASVQECLAAVARDLGPRLRQVRAAGLATQRSSIVCWARDTGVALSPVISWADRRAGAWLQPHYADDADIHRRTGLHVTPHYGASKLRWCLDNLPAVRAAHDAGRLACGPLASFLLHRLLRERPLVVDPANAARTLLWNLAQRDWDGDLLQRFGVPRAVLPESVPTRHTFGHLVLGGLEIPLLITSGDQSAALFAYGAPAPDTAYINMGTGAFMQCCTGAVLHSTARLLAGIVAHDGRAPTYVLEGTVNGAASALAQVGAQVGMSPDAVQQQLPHWLNSVHNPPLFLNGVSGIGSPYWVADFASRFVGDGGAAEQLVAVVESIVFLLQVNLEAMQAALGPLRRVVVTGGLSAYAGLCQRLADLGGLPVHRPAQCEATARGTAFLLAGSPAVWPAAGPTQIFYPATHPALQTRYARWRKELEHALESCA